MSGHPIVDFQVHQEADVIDSRSALGTALIGFILGAVVVFIGGLIVSSIGGLRPNAAGPGGIRPVGRAISQVEQTPIRDARYGIDLRDTQRRELESWGWADRKAGLARIPIERAIDVVVAEESR
jgi:hypothetical protein